MCASNSHNISFGPKSCGKITWLADFSPMLFIVRTTITCVTKLNGQKLQDPTNGIIHYVLIKNERRKSKSWLPCWRMRSSIVAAS